MKGLVRSFVLLGAASLLFSCAGSEKIWRPAGQKGLDIQGKKLLVMPIKANLPGDQNQLNAAIMGGMMSALGSDAISLQPVQAGLDSLGLGGLSPLMARGLVWAAWHDGKLEGEFASVPGKIATLVAKAGELLNVQGLNVDYVVVGHVQQVDKMAGLVKYKVLGGVYCPKSNKIMVAFEYEKSTAESALPGEMAMLGKEIASRIIGEAEAPKQKAEPGESVTEPAQEKAQETEQEKTQSQQAQPPEGDTTGEGQGSGEQEGQQQ